MKTYTAFIAVTEHLGMIFRYELHAENVANAIDQAYDKHRQEMGIQDSFEIHLYGIAEGSVNMIMWENCTV